MILLSRFAKILYLAGLSLILLACGDPTATTVPSTSPTTEAVPTTVPSTTAASTTTAATTTSAATIQVTTVLPTTVRATSTSSDGPAAKARQAVQDEIKRSQNIDPSDLQFVLTENQDWPDSSLGCPKPGELYSQIVTSGYRIVVLVKSQNMRYEYHTNLTGKAVLCKP